MQSRGSVLQEEAGAGFASVHKRRKRQSNPSGSELALFATPAHKSDDAAVSGKRTRKKQNSFNDTPNAATPDLLGAVCSKELPLEISVPLSFEDPEAEGAVSSPAAAEAGVSFRSAVIRCSQDSGSGDFEDSMETSFESATFLQVQGLKCEGIMLSVDIVLDVMNQAVAYIDTLLGRTEGERDNLAAEALQSVGFSLCLIACSVEQVPSQAQEIEGAHLVNKREELFQLVLKLFSDCLRRWSLVSVTDESEKSLKRAKPGTQMDSSLASAAAASLKALTKFAADESNERHCIKIMTLSMDAVLCDQFPVIQEAGIKVLKKMFCIHTDHRRTLLNEVMHSSSCLPCRFAAFSLFLLSSSFYYLLPLN